MHHRFSLLHFVLVHCAGLALLALALALAAGPARAQDFDVFGALRGPYQAGGKGQVLPGDAAAASCAETDSAALLEAPLGLAEAIRVALCNNPRARQSWYEAAAQAALVGTSKGAYLPTLSAGLNKSYDVNHNPNSSYNRRTTNQIEGANFTLNWLLLDGGGRQANVQAAQQNLAAALAGQDGTLQQIFVAAAQAYYEAAAGAAAVAAARQAEETARESAQAAEFKAQVGAATKVDALQARTAFSQATLARVRAEGQARSAIGALAHALGVDVRSPLRLAADEALDPEAESGPAPAEAFLQRLDALIEEAIAAHPSLVAARAQVAAAEARLAGLRSEGFPTLSLSHSGFLNGRPGTALPTSRTYERLTAITLSFPIFEGFSRNYRLHEQRAQIEARRADLAGQQSQVAYEVWRAYEALQVEASSLAATADLMRSAGEGLQAAKARYQAGAADTIDLLNAQKDAANARQERILALASWRLSRLRLLAGLGRLGFWALGA